jgi:integrase
MAKKVDGAGARPKGSGSLRPIGEPPPNGSAVRRWELRVNLSPDPVTGRRRQQSETFKGTEKQAHAALAKLIARTAEARDPATEATFGYLLEAWLERCERNLAASTVAGYRRIVDCIWMPKLGHVALSKLEPRHLQAVLDWDHGRTYMKGKQKRKITAATVLRHWACAREALNSAVRMGWIPVSPGDRVELPSASKPRVDLDDDALLEILATADGMDPALGLILRVATISGARRSEQLGLRWRDVDWKRNRVRFAQGVVVLANPRRRATDPKRRPRRVVITDTKSHKDTPVTLDADSMLLLGALHEWSQANATAMGCRVTRDSFVFSREPDGSKPLRPDWLSTAFKRAARKAGHPDAHLHQLRHLSASVMLSHGIPTAVASKRLGHARETTTTDFYSHAIQTDEAAAQVLARVLFPKQLVEPTAGDAEVIVVPGRRAEAG